MTHTTTDTTNADLRKLIAAQTEAIREIAAERDELISVALNCGFEIGHLESDLRTWRYLFTFVLGYAVTMTFAFIWRCG